MQSNNLLRPFSTSTTNIYSDSDIGTNPVIGTGAVNGSAADSKLYNALSATATLPAVALADFIAAQNTATTFGITTTEDDWITAINNAVATKQSVDNIINGTTTVGNATNAQHSKSSDNALNLFNSIYITCTSTTAAVSDYSLPENYKGTLFIQGAIGDPSIGVLGQYSATTRVNSTSSVPNFTSVAYINVLFYGIDTDLNVKAYFANFGLDINILSDMKISITLRPSQSTFTKYNITSNSVIQTSESLIGVNQLLTAIFIQDGE